MRALDLATSQPWMITAEMLQIIVSISERHPDLDALLTRSSRPLVNSRRASTRDGVAIVPITGPVFRYANLFTEISGATSIEILARDIRTAIDDPLVTALVLEINSPGGTVAGINELADMIFEARGEKPIIAYGDGQIASAAYWLASAADEIVIDPTAVLGSVGVVLTVADTSGRDEKAGIRTIEIVSSQSPDKRLDAKQDAGRAKLQKIVDDLAGVFVGAVARNRDVDLETVLADYGRGGNMVGQVAIDAGMADRLGSLDSVVSLLSQTRNPHRSFLMTTRSTAAGANKGPITVATTAELHAALLAGHEGADISIAVVDVTKLQADAVAAAVKDLETKHTAAIAKANADTLATERARISGLQAVSMKGFETELQAAIDSGATVEAFAVSQSKLAKDRGVTVGTLAAGASKVVPHGGAQPADPEAKGSGWANITKRFNKEKKSA